MFLLTIATKPFWSKAGEFPPFVDPPLVTGGTDLCWFLVWHTPWSTGRSCQKSTCIALGSCHRMSSWLICKVQRKFAIHLCGNTITVSNYSQQECILVGCVPSAAVAVCWGGCFGGCLSPGGWCIPACTEADTPTDRILDICLCKHYLSATSFTHGN